jgi:phage shock protein A
VTAIPSDITTPLAVERRLRALSVEIDDAHDQLRDVEAEYQQAKAKHEVEFARAYLTAPGSNAEARKAYATVEVEQERFALALAEAKVRAARENSNRLRTQVEIVRSVGTSVRASMEIT